MGLDEQLISIDRITMMPVLSEAGIPFPEEKRRKGFAQAGSTIVTVTLNGTMIGYFEYCRDWDNPDDIYIGSLQILPSFRSPSAFMSLIAAARKALKEETFSSLISEVQKNNTTAVALYRKFGFRFERHTRNDKSYKVSAGRELLDGEKLLTILNKWHNHAMHSDADFSRR